MLIGNRVYTQICAPFLYLCGKIKYPILTLMIRKIFGLIAVSGMLLFPAARAQQAVVPPVSTEGMWLPLKVEALNQETMKKLGLEMDIDEVYNEEGPSVEDAIVKLNGGSCTSEMISDQGLMLTNHHCAYDAIATLSSVDADYLTRGFWAATHADELPIEGGTAAFMIRSEDVTERVMAAGGNPMAMQQVLAQIESEASEDGKYDVEVKEMFHGAEYYLFVYKVYTDVRLVGAPPSSIGKYGGDTDNWMWPRHTGDFSLLRVYAGPDNEPADYSPANKPYKPVHHLPISLKGVKANDYTMVLGYPGSTSRYLTAAAVQLALDQTNQDRIHLLGQKLDVMKKAMDADDATRIALASDYASLSNYHKYLIGQTLMLNRYEIADVKRKGEAEFQKWADANPDRKSKYGKVISDMTKLIEGYVSTDQWMSYLNLGAFGADAAAYGIQYYRLSTAMAETDDLSKLAPMTEAYKAELDEHFEDFYYDIDREIFYKNLLSFFNNLPSEMLPAVIKEIPEHKKAKKGKTLEEKLRLWTDYAYSTSILTDKARASAFLEAPTQKVIDADLLVQYASGVISYFRAEIGPNYGAYEAQIDGLSRIYIEGLREMNPDKSFYPDANSTMRLTYGKVLPYEPRDGVMYSYQTTIEGVFEKEDPSSDEFTVPAELKQLWEKKDYGRYAENGDLPVCFLSTNDITGGNSGSPVLNARGELIGCAFDGNWESMASDIYVFPHLNRTISVDIRYVLFIIEKFAGAKHIIDELTIVE